MMREVEAKFSVAVLSQNSRG